MRPAFSAVGLGETPYRLESPHCTPDLNNASSEKELLNSFGKERAAHDQANQDRGTGGLRGESSAEKSHATPPSCELETIDGCLLRGCRHRYNHLCSGKGGKSLALSNHRFGEMENHVKTLKRRQTQEAETAKTQCREDPSPQIEGCYRAGTAQHQDLIHDDRGRGLRVFRVSLPVGHFHEHYIVREST
jgi:hypothetical protein